MEENNKETNLKEKNWKLSMKEVIKSGCLINSN